MLSYRKWSLKESISQLLEKIQIFMKIVHSAIEPYQTISSHYYFNADILYARNAIMETLDIVLWHKINHNSK